MSNEVINVRYVTTKDGATYLRVEDVQALLLAFAGSEDTDVRTRCEDLCRRLAPESVGCSGTPQGDRPNGERRLANGAPAET